MLNNTPGRRGPPHHAGVGRLGVVRAIVLGVLLAAVISTVLLVEFLPSNQVLLNAGDISSEDILAPRDLTYRSEIRTVQAQDAQAAAIPDFYQPPDTSVARQQEVRARQIMDYINTVRQDPYASPEEKADLLTAIPDLDLSPAVIDQILALDDDEWQAVVEETVRVLNRAMQGEIREIQVSDVRRRLPTYVSLRMTDDQADVVEAIAGGLVTANTFYNAARTEEARQQARQDTPPVSVTVNKGEAIVRAGDRVRPEDIEALEAYGLRQHAIRWPLIVGTILLSIIVTILLELVVFRLQPAFWTRGRASAIVFVLIALFVVMGKVMLPLTDTIVPYLYPLPALTMIITILFGPALGLALGAILGLLGAYIAGGAPEITSYLLVGTLMGGLSLGQAERLKAFLRAGATVAIVNAAVIVLFGFLGPELDILKVAIAALAGIVSGGMSTSLALAAFFVLSAVLDVITPFQLMELSRPTHPLLRQLLLKAPGTYHHTILVANMAEEAAERIGADGLLTRVGTYYHDIGKTVRPYFFTENRVGNVNPHERLDPYTSAQIILNHVTDGIELAEKYHLPSAIRAFIPEHHGTGIVLAFYRMALKAADSHRADDYRANSYPAGVGEGGDGRSDGGQDNGRHGVREEDFRYPGPKPQSRETAITMLADSCEARVRSAEPGSVEEIDRIIGEAIKDKLDAGQLDESDLTLRDLKSIHAAFLSVLKGVFHPRVKYPDPVKVTGPDGRLVEI
jgi:putative nucleotidyltransferase with HDIG domain